MRLRAELLPEAQRAKFIHDLKEMEDLVGSSLDLFAELGKSRERYPVDINALLESIITDWGDTGTPIKLAGQANAAYPTEPAMLKRAINNLISNGIRYGNRVEMSVVDSPRQLRIFIRDHGPASRGRSRARLRTLRASGTLPQPQQRRLRHRHGHHPQHRPLAPG